MGFWRKLFGGGSEYVDDVTVVPHRMPVSTVGEGVSSPTPAAAVPGLLPVAPTEPETGILSDLPPPFSVPPAPFNRRSLLPDDYARAAAELGVDVPTVKAVATVESRGTGFLPDGRPVILYEAHVFHRLTKGRYAGRRDRYGVHLSVPAWDRSLYGAAGAHQHHRLADAATLDVNAAIQAASWGMFQVLGTNHAALGYPSPRAFMAAASEGAGEHLKMFVAFVQVNGLVGALKRKDWAGFAARYNGPGYAANGYHTKIAAAYAREKAV